jgi:hypothetical protein
MHRADVAQLYDLRDIAGLYDAAAGERNSDWVRQDAYWYLCMLADDEQAAQSLAWLHAAEDLRLRQYAAKHHGSAPPAGALFTFDHVRPHKRRWWQRMRVPRLS